LAAARNAQGVVLGKAEAIGLEGLQSNIRDSLTTSAIEGEKLDPESVRSSFG
jgi:hypothetical protein